MEKISSLMLNSFRTYLYKENKQIDYIALLKG